MKRVLLFICCLVSYQSTIAQSTINIDLADWKGKQEDIPFTITQVDDNRGNTTAIGTLIHSKKKQSMIQFESNSAAMIQQYIDNHFSAGTQMDITMVIDKLEIIPQQVKNKEVYFFLYTCKFYKANSTLNEPLYKFSSRNSVTQKKGIKLAVTNYISRAINSSILNFKKSYNKHPEWQKENMVSPDVKIERHVLFNQFRSVSDTIPLDGKYQLTPNDFNATVGTEEIDDAYSFFMMTYTLNDFDANNKISLDIFPQAFFLRSQSWAKKDGDNKNWLAHQQLLFDLASYYAIKMNNELKSFDYSAGFYKAEVNKIYNKISADYFDEMDQLQSETKFGSIEEKELAWRKKVDGYLKK